MQADHIVQAETIAAVFEYLIAATNDAALSVASAQSIR